MTVSLGGQEGLSKIVIEGDGYITILKFMSKCSQISSKSDASGD